MIVRPDPEDPYNSCKMSIMLQNDIKGWIPHFVVNAFAARAPLEWRDSLANYYTNVYSKRNEEGGEEGSAPVGQSTATEGGEKGESADSTVVKDQSAAAEGGEQGTEAAAGGEKEVGGDGEGTSGEGQQEEVAATESETKEEDKAEAPAEE